MASRLGQFCISVTDLERSEDFYTRVLGLDVQQRIEIPEAKEIVLGAEGSDGKLQLAQKTAQQGAIDHGDEALWKFYLYTDDIEGIYQAAMDYGCVSETPPTPLAKWPVTIAMILDPDGYRIEIIQRN
ncbi:MAG: VOC family protein [Halioglobus sp.]|nr:VOC family protein [Halioglobus sp.]